jgi:transposase-like protein
VAGRPSIDRRTAVPARKVYRRRESSVEEALIEMYLAGISVRRVEDITEALWGTRVSPSTVSNLNQKIYAKIEAWRNRRIEGEHPYLYLDGIVMKRSWAGEARNVSLLVASAVNSEGFRTRVVGAFPDGQSCLNPGGRATTVHRRHNMVGQMLHEHATTLSTAPI